METRSRQKILSELQLKGVDRQIALDAWNEMEELMEPVSDKIEAIGVSVRPRDQEGSYMPCFTVGASSSRILAAAFIFRYLPFLIRQGILRAAYDREKIMRQNWGSELMNRL